jgi:hypothetical protein
MKKIAVIFMLIAIAAVGCTGTFKLTRQVYDFQTKPADKWVDEVLFLALVIVPVYEVATVVDAVVFNSIEFWTGKNPMTTGTQGTNNTIAQNGNSKMSMKYDAKSQDIEVKSLDTGKSFVLARTDSGVVAKDKEGNVLFTSVKDSSGGVTVFDADNNPVRHFSPQEVQNERNSLSH